MHMLNPESGEDSEVVKVLAMPPKIGKNLPDTSVPHALAAEHVSGVYTVGYLASARFAYNTISLPS